MADSPKAPLTNKPGVSNWVEKFNALPKGSWIRRAAEHIKAKGHPTGTAIAFAVKAAERVCSSGDTNLPGLQQVNPKSRAEACAALAVWKKAAAQAKASDLTTRREVTQIDLACAYIDHHEFGNPHLPRGAAAAYLDLAADDAGVIDLAFDEGKHPRDELGRWIQVAAELVHLDVGKSRRVSTGFTVERQPGDKYRVTMMKGTRHEQSITASSPGEAASVALGHSMNDKARLAAKMRAQIGKSAKQILPRRVNSRGMVLTELREAALDMVDE